MPEHLFEISQRTKYWTEKTIRRAKDSHNYVDAVFAIMEERQVLLRDFIIEYASRMELVE